MVLPGTYAESALTIPAGVSLTSEGSYEVTFITGSAVTGTRIILSNGCAINGFTITIPTDALYGVQFAGTAGQIASARFLKFNGQASALGSGIANTGAGKIIAFEVRYGVLDCANILLTTAGILAIQSVHVPNTAGTVTNVGKVSGGRFQALDLNIGSTGVEYAVEIGTGGIAVLLGLNVFNVKNGLHITGNDAQIDALGGKIQTTATISGTYPSLTGYSIVVDPAIDLTAAVIHVTAQMEPNLFWNNTTNPNAAASDFSVNLIQNSTAERDAASRTFGVDSMIGFPERGSQFFSGEGGANPTFNKVVQLNAADAFVADITAAAATKTGSTFTFATAAGAVDESIAWCSTRRDQFSEYVKSWGIILTQATAATGTGATYVFELWNGASWAEVGAEAVSVAEQYRYANNVFLRASSNEQIRLGITSSTTWATSTIDSQTGYWARVRISAVGSMTLAPTFDQLKTAPSHFMLNAQGQKTLHGLSQYRRTLFGAGNMWGEGGGAADYTVTVGSGVGAETWSQKNKKGRINAANDFVNFQFAIPGGLSTAHTVKFKLLYSTDTATGVVDLETSVLPVEALGNLIADSAGGITPIARTSATAYNVDSAQVTTQNGLTATNDTITAVTFNGFDISNYYEDDIMIIRVGFGATNKEIDIWALIIEGVAFTEGKIL